MKLFQVIFPLFFFLTGQGQKTDGLIARYNFDSQSEKETITDNKAILYGTTAVPDRFGNKNSAVQIHGNYGSYINLGTSDSLKPKQGSVSLWVKLEHVMIKGRGVESNPIIYTRSHAGEDFNEAYYIGYEINTKNIGACVSASEMHQVSVYSGKEFRLHEWHHIVATYDNSYFCLYIDGALEAKMIKNFESSFLKGDSIIVGNRVNEKNTRFLNAYIDDIEIYNKPLNAAEVISLYNAPNPNKTGILLKWIGIAFLIIVFILFLVWIIRKRFERMLKNEREKNELLARLYEQDNRILKAQMNPHFIFNSLNSIQQFIITGQNEKAELYLSKFAKLMRKLLESNTLENISLSAEIELIEKYLEIETLRFQNAFVYEIEVMPDINPHATHIPHFLIQPVVENAIWHGLLPKTGSKKLKLTFKRSGADSLSVCIDDNGVGRRSFDSSKSEKQSLALQFIEQRLELMSKNKLKKYNIKITDKVADGKTDGTLVCITMPLL